MYTDWGNAVFGDSMETMSGLVNEWQIELDLLCLCGGGIWTKPDTLDFLMSIVAPSQLEA